MEVGFGSFVQDADVYLYKDITPLWLLRRKTKEILGAGVDVPLCVGRVLSAFPESRLWLGNLGERCSLCCRDALLQDQSS
jgi:hypothetical protein